MIAYAVAFTNRLESRSKERAAMSTSISNTGARVLRFGFCGAITAALIYTGLWAATQLPIGPSDLIVELFTTREPASTAGLREGVLYAALIGSFIAVIGYLAVEGLRWLEQR
jgi:hypothetical protein